SRPFAEAKKSRIPSGSRDVSGARTIRATCGADAGGADHGTRGGGEGNGLITASCAGTESGRRGSKSASKTFRRRSERSGSSTMTDQPRLPSRSGGNPAFPKFSEPIHATRPSTIAYFAWRYRYRFTTSGPPASHRTSTPAANRPPTTRCSSSSTPPTGEPSSRIRTCTPRSAAAPRTEAIRSLCNVYTPTANRNLPPAHPLGHATGPSRVHIRGVSPGVHVHDRPSRVDQNDLVPGIREPQHVSFHLTCVARSEGEVGGLERVFRIARRVSRDEEATSGRQDRVEREACG